MLSVVRMDSRTTISCSSRRPVAWALLCQFLLSLSWQTGCAETGFGFPECDTEWLITGTPEFGFNWESAANDILFQFVSVSTQNSIKMNSREGGRWGQEQFISLASDSEAQWLVKVNQSGFRVLTFPEMQELHLFAHRQPWASFSHARVTSGEGDQMRAVLNASEACEPGFGINATGHCAACVPGQFKPANCSSPCSVCPSNSASTHDRTDCVCNPGYTGPNGRSCVSCDQNTYKPQNGSADCLKCPSGSQSPSASTSLTDCKCDPGYTGPDGGPCTACKPGTAKPGVGNASCSICPAGKYSDISAPTTCYYCWWGKYGPKSNQSSKELCFQCPKQYTISEPGSTSEVNCTCIPGTTGPNGGNHCTSHDIM